MKMYRLPNMQTHMLALLQERHRFYTSELGQTHQSLSKLYRKLGKIERVLSEREQRELNRKVKKRLQWAKSVTKSTVENLELQQASLHELLRQCNDLISSYEPPSSAVSSFYHLPQTPWTAHLPPSPFGTFSPYSPVASNPWTARPTAGEQGTQGPQYWDLSMLRERRGSSPHGSSADSGFYEPAVTLGIGLGLEAHNDPNHVYAHEIMSASTYSSAEPSTPNKSTLSEKDDVPELPISPLSPTSPTKVGAEGTTTELGHKRRYSENAIQLIESRLAVPYRPQLLKGTSVGPVPGHKRKVSDNPDGGERHVEGAVRGYLNACTSTQCLIVRL